MAHRRPWQTVSDVCDPIPHTVGDIQEPIGDVCARVGRARHKLAQLRPRWHIPTKWLKASEAAAYAIERGYPEVTVEMIRANVSLDLLPAYAIGTGFFYRLRVDDVDDWLEKRPWEASVAYHLTNGRWIAELDSPE
jgi:hypothetical protein